MKLIYTNTEKLKMIAKTKNFDPAIDIMLSCQCKKDGCDKRSVKLMFLNMLQKVRDDYKFPMIVTSGGRCPLHKNELHRDKAADHQKGLGVDIKITGEVMAMKLTAIASKYGFNAFGLNLKSGFLHVGYRPEFPNDVFAWGY